MEIVKKTSSWEELSDHIVLIVINAHSHVKDYARMQEFINYLNFFDEMSDMLVSKAFFLEVLFDRDLLAQPFP